MTSVAPSGGKRLLECASRLAKAARAASHHAGRKRSRLGCADRRIHSAQELVTSHQTLVPWVEEIDFAKVAEAMVLTGTRYEILATGSFPSSYGPGGGSSAARGPLRRAVSVVVAGGAHLHGKGDGWPYPEHFGQRGVVCVGPEVAQGFRDPFFATHAMRIVGHPSRCAGSLRRACGTLLLEP